MPRGDRPGPGLFPGADGDDVVEPLIMLIAALELCGDHEGVFRRFEHRAAAEAHLGHCHHQPCVRRMAQRVLRSQDGPCAARPAHPSLRDRRDRQRQLAVQEPRLIPSPDPIPAPASRLKSTDAAAALRSVMAPRSGIILITKRGSLLEADQRSRSGVV